MIVVWLTIQDLDKTAYLHRTWCGTQSDQRWNDFDREIVQAWNGAPSLFPSSSMKFAIGKSYLEGIHMISLYILS